MQALHFAEYTGNDCSTDGETSRNLQTVQSKDYIMHLYSTASFKDPGKRLASALYLSKSHFFFMIWEVLNLMCPTTKKHKSFSNQS
jgi:hypothetical protein